MPQIRLEQVSKYYQQEKKAVPAVREIDLTIEQQEFVFVTGSSGAGKSTLLNLIAGEITPTAGAVYLDNVPIGQQRRFGHPRKAGCIGYVPQISQLMRKRTIEENLAHGIHDRAGAEKGADGGAHSEGAVYGRTEGCGETVSGGTVTGRVPPGGAGPGHHQQPIRAGAGRTYRKSGRGHYMGSVSLDRRA